MLTLIDRIDRDLQHRRAQLAALGPAATLARGYAVVQGEGGRIVRTVSDARAGTALRVRVADGAVLAVSRGPENVAGPDGTTSAPADPAGREVSR